jgi:hypothetical protein
MGNDLSNVHGRVKFRGFKRWLLPKRFRVIWLERK